MRKLILTLVAGVVGAFVMSSTAQAVPTFSVVQSNTGLALVTVPSASAFVTFDIIFSYTAGDPPVSGYAVSVTWDGGPIPQFGTVTGTPTNPPQFPIAVPLVITQSGAGSAGTASSYGAAAGFPLSGPQTFTIGTLKLHVAGPASAGHLITPFLSPPDGVVTGLADVVCSPASPGTCAFNSATVNHIPEPATAALLGLGLLGMAVVGRRRRI